MENHKTGVAEVLGNLGLACADNVEAITQDAIDRERAKDAIQSAGGIMPLDSFLFADRVDSILESTRSAIIEGRHNQLAKDFEAVFQVAMALKMENLQLRVKMDRLVTELMKTTWANNKGDPLMSNFARHRP